MHVNMTGQRQRGIAGAEHPRIDVDRKPVSERVPRFRAADLENAASIRLVRHRGETRQLGSQRRLEGGRRLGRCAGEPALRAGQTKLKPLCSTRWAVDGNVKS